MSLCPSQETSGTKSVDCGPKDPLNLWWRNVHTVDSVSFCSNKHVFLMFLPEIWRQTNTSSLTSFTFSRNLKIKATSSSAPEGEESVFRFLFLRLRLIFLIWSLFVQLLSAETDLGQKEKNNVTNSEAVTETNWWKSNKGFILQKQRL